VVQANNGFTCLTTGVEIDLNWAQEQSASEPGGANAAYAITIAGTSAYGKSGTAAIWVTGVGQYGAYLFRNGLYFSSGVTENTITDLTDSATSYVIAGKHTTGIDMTLGTFVEGAMALPNNAPILQKDNQGGIQNLIGLNNGDYVAIGGGATSLQFCGSHTFIPGAAKPPGAAATIQGWLTFADCNGKQRYVPVY
jgi:hypothetical protein